jgi:GH35 family endo-1,4-beta-xylanase
MKLDRFQLNPVCALLGLVFSLAVHGQEARLSGATNSSRPTASLQQEFSNQFLVGVALDGYLPGDYNPDELGLIRIQFAALTPANCMKMMHLQREPGQFDFQMADALVGFAATNQLKVCGHCLVWAKDERTPEWLFRDGAKPASRELLLERM